MDKYKWQRLENNGKYYWKNLIDGSTIKSEYLEMKNLSYKDLADYAEKIISDIDSDSETIRDGEWIDKTGEDLWSDTKISKVLTNSEYKKVSLYESMSNGDSPNGSFGYICVSEKKWYQFDIDASRILRTILRNEYGEILNLLSNFSGIGLYHSDWNRFADIIKAVGYNYGIRWIEMMADWTNIRPNLILIRAYDKLIGLDTHRTHGDDEFVKIQGGWSYTFDYFVTTMKNGRFEMNLADNVLKELKVSDMPKITDAIELLRDDADVFNQVGEKALSKSLLNTIDYLTAV